MRAHNLTTRNVVFALAGAAVLVLKDRYSGPGEHVVQAYAGNVGVSFALYFAALNATDRLPRPGLTAAAAVFVAVTAFELTDGFALMANVYDPVDLLANALGIGLAVLADLASSAVLRRRP